MISLPELNLLSAAEKEELICVLFGQMIVLTDQVNELTGLVTMLNDRLALNSANSSKPPSTNGFNKPNKNKSTRGKSGKKKGGQEGHTGRQLKPEE